MSDTLDSFRETEQEINRLKLEIETLKKEIALVRENAQIEILRLEKINNEHQKLNGKLQKKLSNCEETLNEYRDVAAQFRRKGVL